MSVWMSVELSVEMGVELSVEMSVDTIKAKGVSDTLASTKVRLKVAL